MAAPPFGPEDFKNVIPAANSSLCQKMLLALVKLPTMIYQIISWMMNADKTAKDGFKEWLGLATGVLSQPQSVIASNGTYTNKVRVTWTSVVGAGWYNVYRATSNDSALKTLLATSETPSYDDESTADNQHYFYWIEAKTSSGTSQLSLSDEGYDDPTGGGGGGATGEQIFTEDSTLVIPAGITTADVKVWAPGAGGGYSGYARYTFPSGTLYGGAGGGSGEYRYVKSVVVVPAETLTIEVGRGGAGGIEGSRIGGSGGSSYVRRSTSTIVVRAMGGIGGQDGDQIHSSVGGAGGSGGEHLSGVLQVSSANGNAGGNGASGGPGGTAGAAVAGYGAGGAGRYIGDGAARQPARIVISRPGT